MTLVSTSAKGGSGSSATPGTSLPGSPTTGQQAVLTDSTTAPTYSWLLQYDATISGTSKWRFVGGPAAVSVVTTDESTNSGTYTDLATVGPAITVPVAGVYLLEFSAEVYNTGGTADEFVAIKFGTAATSDNDGVGVRVPALNQAETAARLYGQATLTAGEVIELQYRTGAAGGHFRKRCLMVTPVLLG